ncbi:MAG: alanine:cation symporter family protein [Fodinibius sp.]|nr:alanine:cation symporter family protein [Fodinibius sp.]
MGMGNISGVAVAIFMGGPGALFWMWVSAFVGMATKVSHLYPLNYVSWRRLRGQGAGRPHVYHSRRTAKALGRQLDLPV